MGDDEFMLPQNGRGRDESPGHNSVSGAVGGSVVQAGNVSGGVHFHTTITPATAQTSGSSPPRQLPAASILFTGRTLDIDWLERHWQAASARSTGALLVLSGTGGVGKSALALEWLRTHAEGFPDGQLYADLGGYSSGGGVEPSTVLVGFLKALGEAPELIPNRFAEQVTAFRTLTHGRRISVLLDNAVTAAQVRTLALTTPGSVTVVTTRATLSGLTTDGARLHRLEPWRSQTGVTYIERILGEDRVADEPRAAARVAELCGGLPLAVGVAAARLVARPRWTIARLAADLERDGQRLEILSMGEDSAVAKVLEGSYQALSPEDAHLYRAMGACPVAWFDLDMVAALLQCESRQAEDRIDALVDANLVEDLNDRYRFHDLIRLHAMDCAAQLGLAQETESALHRLSDFFLRATTRAEELLTPSHRLMERTYFSGESAQAAPFDDDTQALAWLERHKQNLMMLLRHFARIRVHSVVWQLTDAMWPLFLRGNIAADRLEAQRLAVDAALADHKDMAHTSALNSLSGTLADLGNLREAEEIGVQALAGYRRLGDERGQGLAVNGLAKIYMKMSEWNKAELMFQQALWLRTKVGYRRGVYLTYQGLGRVAVGRGERLAAAGYLRRSYHGLVTLGDRYDAALSLAMWARVTAELGRPRTALRRLHRAEAFMAAAGSARGRGDVLELTGHILVRIGDPTAAREKFAAAADLYAAGDPNAEARLRHLMAETI